MFKAFRIILLLLVLATVAQTAWLTRSRAAAWEDTLYVGIYPIAADTSAATRDYVATLKPDAFEAIDAFIDEEAKRWDRDLWRPLTTTVAPPLAAMPPVPPHNPNALQAMLWSLHMRWWAWRHDRIDGPKPATNLPLLPGGYAEHRRNTPQPRPHPDRPRHRTGNRLAARA